MLQVVMIGFYSVCSPGKPCLSEYHLTDTYLIGTDHPFFPPLDGKEDDPWLSVTTNYKAIEGTLGADEKGVRAVLGGNAIRILNLN